MKKLLKFLFAFAILTNALCLDLGRLLGLRRNWRDSSVNTADPEIVEIVRWRQPVCVVPGAEVSPCFLALRKYQNEYERNSARGLEEKRSDSKNTGKNENETETKRKRETSLFDGIENEDRSNEKSTSSEASMKILTPRVADYVHVENVQSAKLEGSEESSHDHHTMTIRSRTPGIENARVHRRGKYLIISTVPKSQIDARATPAISVTKVLNSPVTATLVAKNCFPDIGVPLCDDYQETITIYKDPIVKRTDNRESSNEKFVSFPGNYDHVAESSENHEVNESTDFSNDSSNSSFNDETKKVEKSTGLLGQAIQHVINKPGVLDAIPPAVIDTIANHPGILEAIADAGQSENYGAPANVATTIQQTELKPQIYAIGETHPINVPASTSRPGLIGSLLEKPAILGNFGFNIFDKSTSTRPFVNDPTEEHSGGSIIHDFGQNPVVQTIQDIVKKPEVVGVKEELQLKPVLVIEPTKKPGFFENLWSPGSFGIFNKISPIVTTERTKDSKVQTEVSENEKTKVSTLNLAEKPEKPKINEIFFKPENDISGRPSLPHIFNKVTHNGKEHEAKPTEAPGIFGGLFSNSARPSTIDESVENTKTLLGIGSSIFPKIPNKPLVIERPGEKPLLIEKPIYLTEKPSHPSTLLNFFVASENEPLLGVDHQVIKEPVYVYQKPESKPGVLSQVFTDGANSWSGFFQGWAIFGNREAKPSKNEKNSSKNETGQVSPAQTNLRQISEQTTITTETEKSIVTESAKSEKIATSIVDIDEEKSDKEENTELTEETLKIISTEPAKVEEISTSDRNVDEHKSDPDENTESIEEAVKKISTEPPKSEKVSASIVDVEEQKFDQKENTEVTNEADSSRIVEVEKVSKIVNVNEEKSQNVEENIEAISTALEKNSQDISTKSVTPVHIPEKIVNDPNSEELKLSEVIETAHRTISEKPAIDKNVKESPKEPENLPEIEAKIEEIEDILDQLENVEEKKLAIDKKA